MANLGELTRRYGVFSVFYLLFFFAIGAFLPLQSVYLQKELHFTGQQLGLIVSLTPIITIIMQPLWGFVSDYSRKPRLVLIILLLASAAIGLVYPLFTTFALVALISLAFSAFQCAINPLADSLAISHVQKVGGNYGSIRLWGAIGFALASFVAGKLADIYGLNIIFYLYAAGCLVALLLVFRLPKGEQSSERPNIRAGLKQLIKMPRYLLFMIVAFAVFGPVFANNYYFGIFITDSGGTLQGVGLAFLLAAGSEAPFMQVAQRFIRRFGIVTVIVLASLVSCLRWFFYFTEPSLSIVYATTVAQGFSVGLFVPAALQYIRDITPSDVRASAIAIYSAVGYGLGTWFCVYVGGILLDYYSIFVVYAFYSVMTVIGIGVMLLMRFVK